MGAEGFDAERRPPLPLAFLDDARDLRRHALMALDGDGTSEVALWTHPDPVGLRAMLLAGLAASVLPKPAIVPPLQDIGARLDLPALGSVPVSVYGAERAARGPARELAGHLLSGLVGREPG